MPIWLYILLLILLGLLALLFSTFFLREWKFPNKKNYPKHSIKKFIASNALAIYGLLAATFILSIISIATLI